MVISRLTGDGLEALCRDILVKSLKLLPAGRGVVLLADRNGELHARFVERPSGQSEEEFVVSGDLAREAAESNKSIIVAATSEDPRTTDLFRAGVRSVAVIPLHHSGENLGLLYLDSMEPFGGSSEIGAQLCDLLAGQLSAEIQLARLRLAIERGRAAMAAMARSAGATAPTVVDDD